MAEEAKEMGELNYKRIPCINHPVFKGKGRAPLLERNPILFWKGLSLFLLLMICFLLGTHPVFEP